jgi:hypothetical protein
VIDDLCLRKKCCARGELAFKIQIDFPNLDYGADGVRCNEARCTEKVRDADSSKLNQTVGDRYVCDIACGFSPVENEEIIRRYLYSLRNRRSNNMKFTDLDSYGAPLCSASFLAKVHAKKCQMEQRAVVRFLTLKGLKTKEIEMEITNVHGDEALQIYTGKKWQTRFLQGRLQLGDGSRSGRPANSDLT